MLVRILPVLPYIHPAFQRAPDFACRPAPSLAVPRYGIFTRQSLNFRALLTKVHDVASNKGVYRHKFPMILYLGLSLRLYEHIIYLLALAYPQ